MAAENSVGLRDSEKAQLVKQGEQKEGNDCSDSNNSTLTLAKLREIDCKQGAVRAVRYSVDGNYCFTAGQDKSMKLWNPLKGNVLKTYMGHGFEVLDVKGSCDNSQIVSCSMDKTVVLWDVSSGTWSRKWRGHQGSVNCVAFNEDSSVVLSGSVDTTVKVWDCRSRSQEPIQSIDSCGDTVTSIDVSDHEILVGAGDSRVRRFDIRKGSLVTDFVGGSVSSVSFTRDGGCLLVSSLGNSIRLLDKLTGEMLAEYSGHLNRNYRLDSCMDFSDQFVLSGSENGCVCVWDMLQGSLLLKLDHGQGAGTVHSLAQHPTRARLLSASRGTVFVWVGEGGEEEQPEQEKTISSASQYDMKPHWM